jgi:hypothetical protein
LKIVHYSVSKIDRREDLRMENSWSAGPNSGRKVRGDFTAVQRQELKTSKSGLSAKVWCRRLLAEKPAIGPVEP